MSIQYQPCRERIHVTLMRTVAIAAVVGAVWAAASRGGMRFWPIATLLALWPALGGYWIEVFFLNVLRPALPPDRAVLVLARVTVWFAGGIVLALGMFATSIALRGTHASHLLPWWIAGFAFIGIELAVHLGLQIFGRKNFYDGRG